ncbi:MAG TPA: hypothetical protein VMG61_08350, partial [Usitatibacter sp.]|nr:hypothetical protein [Usitatibacter sp.]
MTRSAFILVLVLASPAAALGAAFPPAPESQTVEQAHAKSVGCMSCHTATDRHTMHQNPGVILG